MAKIAETYSAQTSAEIAKKTGISMPTLQRYRKLYQRGVQGEGDTESAGEKKLQAKARRPRRHVTPGASASEIRKALGISKKDLAAARRDLAALHLEKKIP